MYDTPTPEAKQGFAKLSGVLGGVGSFVFESIEAIVIALAICVVLYLFLVTPHEVIGRSMQPNFVEGEYLIANKLVYKFKDPERGDVVIFKHSPTQDYIKRVIAVPGDDVSVLDGNYYINGEMLDESEYLADTVYTEGGTFLHEGETYTVKEGEIFASGDNRPHSTDSRAFGPVKQDDVKGRVWFVYFPLSNFRIIQHPNY
ncbi:MAG: signal peptidase I [Candidatus Dojkabacteria bacterium]|nr:MAG: signal peptidase I [Candidatus Dojkabacteria bacterium]